MARLRAAGALAVLLALLVAVPAALVATIGNPTAGFGDLAAGDVTDTALIGLLAGVAWLAWAQFALATLVELFAAARGIRVPVRIPGVLSGQQHLARTLVAAVLLLGPAAASAVMPAGGLANLPAPTTATVSLPVVSLSATSMPSAHWSAATDTGPQTPGRAAADRGAHPSARPADDAVSTVLYVVPATGHGPATLWDIAEARLGSGERWHEIWALNEGRQQPGGATFRTPGRLLPGWTVLVPEPATGGTRGARPAGDAQQAQQMQEVVVEPGDTLSGIAAEHGQPSWQPMWQANAGRDEPAGARFTDPDLIRPGWRLSIPPASPTASTPAAPAPINPGSPAEASAPVAPGSTGPAPAPAEAPPPSPAVSTPAPSVAAPAPTESSSQAATTAPGSAGPPAADPVVPSAPSAPSASQQPAPAPPAATDGDVSTASDGSNWPRQVAFTGSGVLLAAVTLEGLLRLRRRQFRDRALGRTIAATPAAIAPMEKALLARGASGAPDVAWLSAALRSLAQTVAADPAATLPDVVAVRLDADVLELVLTTAAPAAPAPWRSDASGQRWSLRRDDELAVDADADVSAPYPTLATVGQGPDGDHWLLDLERVGALSLTGDQAGCENLARYLAAELAHNAWSDQLLVTLVGFGPELAGLNPARVLHQSDLAQATRDARATIAETRQVLTQTDTSVLDGRLRPQLVGDGWSPHVLLVAPGQQPATGTAGLAALLADVRAQRSRTAVAVVLAADTEHAGATRWQLHVGADGVLSVPELDLHLQAAQLPAEEAADLAALLTLAAQGPDAAMPLSAGQQPWEAFIDAAGALRPELARPREHAPAGPVRSAATGQPAGGAEPTRTLLPETAGSYLASTATTAKDVAALAPVVDPEVRRQVEQADPGLDEDLQLWHDPDSGIAKLTVLGPVSISACAGAPSNLRRDRVVEVVAYLACRPQGVSTEQWIAQMWPGEVGVPDSRPRAYANSARQWLGKDPRTGQDYLPRATEGPGKVGSYRLRGVLIDADLFRRLRLRASAHGADGLADLEAALGLVSGEPLSRLRASGGAWLVDTPVQHHYTAMIVDVAHLVATAHLAAGDPAGAERAAQVSLLTGSRDDVALLDLVAVHDAAGEHAQADRYVARILANHDAEVEEDLPPRTYEVLCRRQWLPTRGARAS